ncbi:MAG: hypothetical protein R3E45_06285 [Rhodocyclaceae bacterium]
MNAHVKERDTIIERYWPLVVRMSFALALANLLAAILVAMGGARIHPLFSDPLAWMFFAVSGLALLAQSGMMLVMSHFLWGAGDARNRRATPAAAWLRLPLERSHDTVRLRSRQHMRSHREMTARRSAGRPFSRP